LSIFFDYPYWTLILLLLSPVLAVFLYKRPGKLKESFNKNPYFRWLLFGLRSTYLLLLFFLILNPKINKEQKHIQRPKILFAQDNSISIINKTDSLQVKEIRELGSHLKKALINDYDFEFLSFGKEVNKDSVYKFNEHETNIGKLFKYIHYQYSNENTSAIVLSTDGIYNRGENPLYLNPPPSQPVYSIALGDTNKINDLLILKAEHNDISLLNNYFIVHPLILSKGLSGDYKINIYSISEQKETLVKSQQFSIKKGQEKKLSIKLKAKSTGIKHFRLKIDSDIEDKNNMNDTFDFFIDIIDDRQRILLTYDSPHPDIGCIKQIFQRKENIKLDIIRLKDIKPGTINRKYDLVILYQLPSKNNSLLQNKKLFSNLPKLFIVGNNSDLLNLNKLQSSISCRASSQTSNEVHPSLVNDFSLFQVSEGLKDFLANAPPLISPFSDYKKVQGNILMYQKLNGIKTGYPLLIINSGINKEAILVGEGIWRWRINEFLYHNSFEYTDDLFSKVVNYLAQKEDKRKFRAKPNKKIFEESELVSFTGQLYDESYETIRNANIRLEIFGKDSIKQSYEFQDIQNKYQVDIGYLASGDYQYKSRCKWQDKTYDLKGSFSVKKGQLEYIETIADHSILRKLGKNTNGNIFYINDIDDLTNTLKALPKKNMSFFSSKIFDLIDEKLIFFIILFLMCLEWGIRKWLGFI
jgi:hypothetical protein